ICRTDYTEKQLFYKLLQSIFRRRSDLYAWRGDQTVCDADRRMERRGCADDCDIVIGFIECFTDRMESVRKNRGFRRSRNTRADYRICKFRCISCDRISERGTGIRDWSKDFYDCGSGYFIWCVQQLDHWIGLLDFSDIFLMINV